jgi:sulfate transport system ATP-binding protein
MSISLQRITKRYQANPVVNDVSLEIPEGEFFVLLGPSGSGKSTLLRSIAGLSDIDQGAISLHGRDVTRVPVRERGVGFVFQNYALFRHMSVADNIEFALSVRKVKAAERVKRRRELLELVQLTGMDDRFPAQLSGGQQQRIAVARALAHKPQVLLLDEPFGALDAKIREELRWTIRRVQRELGITTVLVTHDQEEAFALADRIGVMNLGRLLAVDEPLALYARPPTRFVATFLGAANLLLAQQGPDGIRVGATPVDASGRQAEPGAREHEVVVVLRPEDVELAADRADLSSSYVSRAVIETAQFTGPLERLRLRLLDNADAIQHDGSDPGEARIEVARPLPEQRALPLHGGDTVALGARRLHVLPTPLSSFVVHAADTVTAHTLQADPLLATLAARMKTRVLVEPVAVSPGAAPGVAVIPLNADGPARSAELIAAGSNEVLLLSGGSALPSQVCIYWMDDAARGATLAVAASLLRHLPGEAICLAAAPAGRRDPARTTALRALLDARAEGRAVHALEARTELLDGDAAPALTRYLGGLEAPLLVLGASNRDHATALLRELVAAPGGTPLLLVYREPAG